MPKKVVSLTVRLYLSLRKGELSVGIIDWSDDEVPITGAFL